MAYDSDLDIALRQEARPGALRVHYTITNEAGQPVYVYTCVAGPDYGPLPHRAYTALRDRPKALHLFLGLPPVPAAWRLYARVSPFASCLLPRQSVTGYVEVPVPVREWSPYFPDDQSPDTPVVSTDWVILTTECFREKDAIFLKKADGYAGRFRGRGYPQQRAGAHLRLSAPVAVHKRTDDFVRF